MLIQLVAQHPDMLLRIVRHTPGWVWGLFAVLVTLGLAQRRDRSVKLALVGLLPLAMSAVSLVGIASAFGRSPVIGYVLLAWLLGGLLVAGATLTRPATPGSHFAAASRSFDVPGSWVPLALILGMFLTRYVVGADLAMQPALAADGPYTLTVGALYGLFGGSFAGRAGRLLRLALQPASGGGPVAIRT